MKKREPGKRDFDPMGFYETLMAPPSRNNVYLILIVLCLGLNGFLLYGFSLNIQSCFSALSEPKMAITKPTNLPMDLNPTKFQPICSAGPFLAKIPILTAHPNCKEHFFIDIITGARRYSLKFV